MAAKKTSTKKKASLKKKQNLTQNPWAIAVTVAVVALLGFVVVRSFAAIGSWPSNPQRMACGVTESQFRYDNDPLPVLKTGSRGECVKTLQSGLVATGFMAKKTGAVDGVYGTKTANSVKLLEAYTAFKVADTVTSSCTWYALQGMSIYGKNNVAKVRSYVKSADRGCTLTK